MEQTVPQHIAIIMDGNRRWARAHKLAIILGHESGAKRLEPLVEHAMTRGVKYLTFWAFSTENWKREASEVEDLMNVFRKALRDTSFQKLHEKNVKISAIGDLTRFPQDIQETVYELVEKSKENTGITVTLALNYGGREEILRAINACVTSGKESITSDDFEQHLYTHDMPDPDLIIRTGGEQRLSGYFPWQSVYSELYFTDIYWPDFDATALDEAIADYTARQRRFGK